MLQWSALRRKHLYKFDLHYSKIYNHNFGCTYIRIEKEQVRKDGAQTKQIGMKHIGMKPIASKPIDIDVQGEGDTLSRMVGLGAYMVDIHVQVICLNVDMFNPSICLIPIRFKADRFKSAIGLNADMFNYR